MASLPSSNKEIKYLNKDFADLRSALVEYAKAYYPNAYNDFSTASPGSMFIDMAAYVGDVMSFYLDSQVQETFLQYAKQKENLYTMAYMLGYRPKVTSAAAVDLDIYQTLPAIGTVPDFRYALLIQEGMQVSADGPGTKYYVPESVDFTVSSSTNPTEVSIFETDALGNTPTKFLLKKTIKAISGEVKTVTVNAPATRTKFYSTTLTDQNIIEIIDVYDSEGNRWYEVPYLAQSSIMVPSRNTQGVDPNYKNSSIEVPYLMDVIKVPRRFTTRYKSNEELVLQFGAGMEDASLFTQYSDEEYLPNAYKVGMSTIDGRSLFFNTFDVTNYVNTTTYGIAPSNTTLTIKYLVGGGAVSNVGSNQVNNIDNFTSSFFGGITPDPTFENDSLSSLAINNPSASTGGADGDTNDQIKLNTLAQFPTQMRAVTEQDYLAALYNLPQKYGHVAKAYISKDIITNKKQLVNSPEIQDNSSIAAYILTYDSQKNLNYPSTALMQNLRTYISNYRMLTDSIDLRSGFIINIGVDFDVVLRPNYSSKEVLANCIAAVKDYFRIDNWQINQPIILSELYTLLDKVVGVQTVKNVEIYNLSDADGDYSQYGYDIAGATINGIVYPSLDPSCFEVKYLDNDIFGRVVAF